MINFDVFSKTAENDHIEYCDTFGIGVPVHVRACTSQMYLRNSWIHCVQIRCAVRDLLGKSFKRVK